MPRSVDHALRRNDVVRALWRVVEREGIEKATMRTIAAEAGVSIGTLQHYFADKDEIVVLAVAKSQDQFRTRLPRLLRALGEDAPPRQVIATILRHRLPMNARQLRQARVLLYWFRREPSAASIELLAESERFVARQLRDALAEAQARRQVPDHLDLRAATDVLVALNDGLLLGLLFGRFTHERALRALDGHLDSLFGAPEHSNIAY